MQEYEYCGKSVPIPKSLQTQGSLDPKPGDQWPLDHTDIDRRNIDLPFVNHTCSGALPRYNHCYYYSYYSYYCYCYYYYYYYYSYYSYYY